MISPETEAAPDLGLRDHTNQERLAEWLHEELCSEWSAVRFDSLLRASGGVSYETWLITASDPSAPQERNEKFVLRREPERGPIEPYNVMDEAAVMSGLSQTEVPVPRLLAACHDESVIGRRFTVLEFVHGLIPDYRTIMSLPEWQDERQRHAMASEFIRVLAMLQSVDWRELGGVEGALEPDLSERERLLASIEKMTQSAERRTESWAANPIFRDALRWCEANAPDGDPSSLVLVHGDYKVGNFIWREGRIVTLLDWEGASVGDPLQDLGYCCHPAMREQKPELMAMLAPLDEVVRLYEQHSGRAVDSQRLHYFVVYALLFHTWTLMVGIPGIIEWDGDMRMATGYKKLSQTTRLLVAEIEAYEGGKGVV